MNRNAKQYKRRDFLKVTGCGLGAFGMSGMMNKVSAASTAGGFQPNLLFVYADQWRRMAMSYYSDSRFDGTCNQGDPVRTPHFDQCAQEGMIFHNSVSVCPQKRAHPQNLWVDFGSGSSVRLRCYEPSSPPSSFAFIRGYKLL